MEKIIAKAKAIQDDLLRFINEDYDFHDFIDKIETYQLVKNKYEFKYFLYMILNISNNHYRQKSFFTRIEQIIQFYNSEIAHHFTNFELFHIFQSNKRIILFLFETKMLNIDEPIFKILKEKNTIYRDYFLPELNQLSKENEINDQIDESTFYTNRKIGENENYICCMIRNDSVIEFIQYINRTNYSLKTLIFPSIFETNSFLLNKMPTMIEYSAFFGSIQIFQYLYRCNV